MRFNNYKIFLFFSVVLFISSCDSGGDMPKIQSYEKIIGSVPEREWKDLSRKRIYFGHQSVGANILNGVKDIMQEYGNIKLNIEKTSEAEDFNAPVFAHARIGKNADPFSKIEVFEQGIRQGIGDKADIAFFKLCYLDITKETDVENLFNAYTQTMERLKTEFPETVFIFTTVPLTTTEMTWKTVVKKLIGRDYLGDNIKRNEFNELLRQKYGVKGNVFDIAKAESLYPDGTQEGFKKNEKQYTSLIPVYTDDGGHLNQTGRKIVAACLLKTLCGVPK